MDKLWTFATCITYNNTCACNSIYNTCTVTTTTIICTCTITCTCTTHTTITC